VSDMTPEERAAAFCFAWGLTIEECNDLTDVIRAAEEAAARRATEAEREACAQACEDEAHRQNRWLQQEQARGSVHTVDFRHGARTGADRCAERIRREGKAANEGGTNDLCTCGHYRRRHVLDAQNCTRCDPEVPCPDFRLARGADECLGGVVHEPDWPLRARSAKDEERNSGSAKP